MSYTYLLERGEESSAQRFSDIEPFVRLRLKNTQEESSWSANETVSSHGFQYGMTYGLLMGNLGEVLSISFVEDSLAKTLVLRGKVKGWRVKGQGSGVKWRGWSAKLDRNTSSWKILQCSLEEDLTGYSWTWPTWGTMQDGVCSVLMMPALPIEENGFGSWRIPTPTCSDAYTGNLRSTQQKDHTMHSVTLSQLVEKMPHKMWATPNCMDSLPPRSEEALKKQYENNRPGRNEHSTLREQVAYPNPKEMWPTPRAREWKDTMSVPPSRKNNPGLATLGQKVAMNALAHQESRQMYPTPGATQRGAHNGKIKGEVNLETMQRTSSSGVSYGATLQTVVGSGQLNPDWVEWLMGWPIGWTDVLKELEDIHCSWKVDPADDGTIPRTTTNRTHRIDRLKAIGNGQVPIVAAMAFSILHGGITC